MVINSLQIRMNLYSVICLCSIYDSLIVARKMMWTQKYEYFDFHSFISSKTQN